MPGGNPISFLTPVHRCAPLPEPCARRRPAGSRLTRSASAKRGPSSAAAHWPLVAAPTCRPRSAPRAPCLGRSVPRALWLGPGPRRRAPHPRRRLHTALPLRLARRTGSPCPVLPRRCRAAGCGSASGRSARQPSPSLPSRAAGGPALSGRWRPSLLHLVLVAAHPTRLPGLRRRALPANSCSLPASPFEKESRGTDRAY